MVTEQQVIDLILIAQSYNLELGDNMIVEQKKGCDDCADKLANQILQLIMLVEQLYYKIELNDYGEETDSLYACLLSAVAAYSGASLSLDPNAVNPNITIEVEIIGNNQPNELTFYWNDFIDNGEEGRVRYENAELAGWTPIFVIGNIDKHLLKFVDFTPLSTGGFELKADGNIPAIYEGQVGWIVGYEPYIAPPEEFTYKLVNNSSIATEYILESVTIPLTVGQTVENPVVVGQAITATVEDGQTCTYTIYNSDGSVQFTTTIIGEATINGVAMVADKDQEFIYIDTV